jgi:Uri superfamily endonuclease
VRIPFSVHGFEIAGLFVRKPERAPSVAGAYVLLIAITDPFEVTWPSKRGTIIEAGRYLYCGSAKGPGGIRARLSRHMRRGKSIRWHVDRLTEVGTVAGAWVFPDGDECALVGSLSHLPVPVDGFGSTDCTRCRSHLLAWPSRLGG